MEKHRSTDTDLDQMHEADKRRRIFIPSIDLGTGIQIAVLVAGMLFGYAKIQQSQALTEQRIITIEDRASEQKRAAETTNAELKADVKDIGKQVGDLKTKIDLLDLKLSQPRQK
jgi:uncharacterized coiled-coil protein SlyX